MISVCTENYCMTGLPVQRRTLYLWLFPQMLVSSLYVIWHGEGIWCHLAIGIVQTLHRWNVRVWPVPFFFFKKPSPRPLLLSACGHCCIYKVSSTQSATQIDFKCYLVWNYHVRGCWHGWSICIVIICWWYSHWLVIMEHNYNSLPAPDCYELCYIEVRIMDFPFL